MQVRARRIGHPKARRNASTSLSAERARLNKDVAAELHAANITAERARLGLCRHGVRSLNDSAIELACCSAKCGGCGGWGSGCRDWPGGAGVCCAKFILRKSPLCQEPTDVGCRMPAIYGAAAPHTARLQQRRERVNRKAPLAAMTKWARLLASLGQGCDVLLITAVQYYLRPCPHPPARGLPNGLCEDRRRLLPPAHPQHCSFAIVNKGGFHHTPGWTEQKLTLFPDDLLRSAHVIKMPCGTTRPVIYADASLASKVSLTVQMAPLSFADVAVPEHPQREWSLSQELLATADRVGTQNDDLATHQRIVDQHLDVHRDWTVPDTSYILWNSTPAAREFAASWFVETVSYSASDQLSFALSAVRAPTLRVATLPNWWALTDGCEPTHAPKTMARQPKGRYCKANKEDVLAKFPITSTEAAITEEAATAALAQCEAACMASDTCTTCSVDCPPASSGMPRCQWVAIPRCGIVASWTGWIQGDISKASEPLCEPHAPGCASPAFCGMSPDRIRTCGCAFSEHDQAGRRRRAHRYATVSGERSRPAWPSANSRAWRLRHRFNVSELRLDAIAVREDLPPPSLYAGREAETLQARQKPRKRLRTAPVAAVWGDTTSTAVDVVAPALARSRPPRRVGPMACAAIGTPCGGQFPARCCDGTCSKLDESFSECVVGATSSGLQPHVAASPAGPTAVEMTTGAAPAKPTDCSYTIVLVKQLSIQGCTPGRTFGCDEDGVWVASGCRALFTCDVRSAPVANPQPLQCPSWSSGHPHGEARCSCAAAAAGGDLVVPVAPVAPVAPVVAVVAAPNSNAAAADPIPTAPAVAILPVASTAAVARVHAAPPQRGPCTWNVTLVKQLSAGSKGQCVFDESYGCDEKGVWVAGGCRGEFTCDGDGDVVPDTSLRCPPNGKRPGHLARLVSFGWTGSCSCAATAESAASPVGRISDSVTMDRIRSQIGSPPKPRPPVVAATTERAVESTPAMLVAAPPPITVRARRSGGVAQMVAHLVKEMSLEEEHGPLRQKSTGAWLKLMNNINGLPSAGSWLAQIETLAGIVGVETVGRERERARGREKQT